MIDHKISYIKSYIYIDPVCVYIIYTCFIYIDIYIDMYIYIDIKQQIKMERTI